MKNVIIAIIILISITGCSSKKEAYREDRSNDYKKQTLRQAEEDKQEQDDIERRRALRQAREERIRASKEAREERIRASRQAKEERIRALKQAREEKKKKQALEKAENLIREIRSK